MGKNRRLKIIGKILGLCLLLMALTATTAFALETPPSQGASITPKLAFAVNSHELLLFQPENMTTPSMILQNGVPVVSIEAATYIPIRAFCEALGYDITSNATAGALTISKNGKTLTLRQIEKFADLSHENTYFSLNGKGYTKVRDLVKVENLQIAVQQDVVVLYEPLKPADSVAPEASADSAMTAASAEGNVAPTPSGNGDGKAWAQVLMRQGDQIVLTDQFVQNMKKSVVVPAENYAANLKKTYDSRYYAPFVNPYGAYSYPQMMADIEKLKLQYPEYITTASAGKSVEGRDLITVEFGRGSKHIYVLGSHHAREYMSTSYIMYFVNQTAYGAKTGNNTTSIDLVNLLDKVTYHIMPMVNPDGVNLVQNGIESVSPALREQVRAMPIVAGAQYGYKAWKTNINGVDLNRNYPSNWDALQTKHKGASAFYPGPYAVSEPETRAVMNYLGMYPSSVVVSMHTQGQWLYWSNPAGELGEMGRRMLASSGFRAEENTRKESKGGFLSNYARDVRQMYEMTIELCNYIGPYPYPDARFDEVWYPAREMLLIVGDEVAK